MFLIEGYDVRLDSWYVLDSRQESGAAQREMGEYRKLFPLMMLRVVGPDRRIVVLNDPRP